MSESSYIGGTHRVSDPGIWQIDFRPGGDLLVVPAGHVVAVDQTINGTIDLIGTLSTSTIDAFETTNTGTIGSFAHDYSSQLAGTVAFVGANTNQWWISNEGQYLADQYPSMAFEIADLTSPSGIVIQRGVLTNTGIISVSESSSGLQIGQSADAELANNGQVHDWGDSLTIDDAVTGTGSFSVGGGHADLTGSVTFSKAVSAGQTIDLANGNLSIDDPANFRATIELTPNYIPFFPFANEIQLRQATVTSASFIDQTLTLMNGSTFVAQFRYAPDVSSTDLQITSDSFGTTISNPAWLQSRHSPPGNIPISTTGTVPVAPPIVLPASPTPLPGTGPDLTLRTGAETASAEKLDGYTIRLEGKSAGDAPSVDTTSTVFGSDFTLRVHGDGGAARYGSYAAVGYNENDGKIATKAGEDGGTAVLRLDISDVVSPTGTTILTGAYNNTGTIDAGRCTTIDITGTEGSKLINSGTLLGRGTLFIGTSVFGTGTITVGTRAGVAGQVETGRAVSTGQSVMLQAGTLTIDDAQDFHGTIYDFGQNDTIVLKGLDVTSVTYNNGALALHTMGADAGTLHLRRPAGAVFATNSFQLDHTVSGDTVITFRG